MFKDKFINLVSKNQDFIFYTISFALYTFIQQIILMPYLSRNMSETDYSFFIIFITIFNILCYAIGDELGNTKLILFNKYKGSNKTGDQNLLLLFSFFFSLLVTIVYSLICKIKFYNIFIILATTMLGIYRHYILSFFKLSNKYKSVLIIFVLYAFGIITGIFFSQANFNFLFILLFGEIFCFLYYIFFLRKIDQYCFTIKKTALFKENFKTYNSLFLISLLFNTISYMDRIIIYPLLGAESMNIYYATTTMSKFASLLINPISNIILARLAVSSKNYIETIHTFLKKYIIWILLAFSIICTIVSFIGVKFLYRQYFDRSLKIIIPVGIAMSFSMIAALLKPILLKYYKPVKFLIVNFLYSLTIIFTIVLTYKYSLIGFTIGIMISKIILLLEYLLCLNKTKEVES